MQDITITIKVKVPVSTHDPEEALIQAQMETEWIGEELHSAGFEYEEEADFGDVWE